MSPNATPSGSRTRTRAIQWWLRAIASPNRVGMTLLSSYQEAFTPQRGNVVVGNLIADNQSADSPSQAEGRLRHRHRHQRWPAERRRAQPHHRQPSRAAVILTNTEDIAALGNRFDANVVDGAVGLANLSAARTPASGNCWSDAVVTVPLDLAAQLGAGCDSDGPQSSAASLDGPPAAPGVSFLRVAEPRDQPLLARSASYALLPDRITVPGLAGFEVPHPDLFADRVGVR